MIWSPYVAPYKNAITNQLFIAASVAMYLYFPGDSNPSPFPLMSEPNQERLPPAKAHDGRYLENAIRGYRWLQDSGMKNEQGLYVDGFHIRGWRGGKGGSNGTEKCDLRDETVYTYNQGVILSGLRGLWIATGCLSYLQDGHELIRHVIMATGWHEHDTAERKWRWAGLGRDGVLEDGCDWSGACSQNAQTFKGIFFHHFTAFCAPLGMEDVGNRGERPWLGDEDVIALHQQSCDGYGAWVEWNAKAAEVTRDEDGEFGQWWGRRSSNGTEDESDGREEDFEEPKIAGSDYRNRGVPGDEIWRLSSNDIVPGEDPSINPSRWLETFSASSLERRRLCLQDINDRGRGRTVETQSGGLAVLRARWRLVDSREDK